MYISHTKSSNIYVLISLATLVHMINVYEICLVTTNYTIFNMQDFRYCQWTSILDCFDQLVSPQCICCVGLAMRFTICVLLTYLHTYLHTYCNTCVVFMMYYIVGQVLYICVTCTCITITIK